MSRVRSHASKRLGRIQPSIGNYMNCVIDMHVNRSFTLGHLDSVMLHQLTVVEEGNAIDY
jgi:hypothetical protein